MPGSLTWMVFFTGGNGSTNNGGICGEKVRVVEIECGYDQPRTVAAFKKLVRSYKVPLVHGFGTPDSLAVVPFSTRTKTIYMPLSYLMAWNPRFAPYYFVTTSTYSTPVGVLCSL